MRKLKGVNTMIQSTEIKPGQCFVWEGDVYQAITVDRNKTAMAKMKVAVKVKNPRTGVVKELSLIGSDRVEEAFIDKREMQYLYNDGANLIFMDTETYEQIEIPASRLEWEKNFLKESSMVNIQVYNGEILGVQLPDKVNLQVTECEVAVKGNTATSATKNATVETGLNVRVPLFINEGEVIEISTTAGTGSEVTAGAVITDPIKKRKYALSHLFLIPKYAVLDSSLLVSLPSKMTAYTGMDALTHAIEAYINCFNNRKTNEYALCAIKSIFQYLVPSFEDGLNKHYRLELLEASYNAGVAISNNYVGYVHAIAHGIGGMYHLQHGMINATILPIVLEEYGSAVVSKLAKIADVVGITGATDQDKSTQFIQKLKDLNQIFSIPTSIPEIKDEDIHYLAIGAEKEGNPSYPTPVTWDVEQFEKVIRKIKHGYTI